MTLREITDERIRLLLEMMEAPEIVIPESDGTNDDEIAALTEQKAMQEQAFADTLEMIQMDFAEKIDGYCTVRSQIAAERDMVKAEKIRLTKEQSRLEKKLERLDNAMLHAMQVMDQKKVKGQFYTAYTRSSTTVQIDAESVFEIPDDYLRYKDPEPDKAAIKKYLKDNEATWAHLEETQSLVIK